MHKIAPCLVSNDLELYKIRLYSLLGQILIKNKRFTFSKIDLFM